MDAQREVGVSAEKKIDPMEQISRYIKDAVNEPHGPCEDAIIDAMMWMAGEIKKLRKAVLKGTE